ncbi:transglutaminase-like domain-containing protein [Candidatus Micrarchaeota archaeon]|nr:transglutaminase-like domain-containing protein [Candidatus Micrarchaeota archaeon]
MGPDKTMVIAIILLGVALLFAASVILQNPQPPPIIAGCTATENKCMGSPPNYCYNGDVVKNCLACGCPEGKACSTDGSCRNLELKDPQPEIKKFNLDRIVANEDIPELETLEDKLGVLNPVLPPEQISPYQVYVTPFDSAVRSLAASLNGKQGIYSAAVSWMWVSEQTLNNESEKWLMPNEFLTQTPSYPNNPLQGRIASDCEEQANTLVSLLRASGIKPENVRVALGKVNFNGKIGGHAWVEIYENGQWFALEPTSGDYWDDDDSALHESDGLPYAYYATHRYPFTEIWYYYNDIYFYNLKQKKGNAPSSWTPNIPRLFSTNAQGMPPIVRNDGSGIVPAVEGGGTMPLVEAA